jgi:hypothetical protein
VDLWTTQARCPQAPQAQQQQKKRTFDVLQNADIFTRYGQPMTRYPALPRELIEELRRVPSSWDREMEYKPCAVTLADGTELASVYVVNHKPYIRYWGISPESDPGKRSVSIAQVRQIRDSPNRLPAALADCLYRAGESGMGYMVFTVEFKDGTRQVYVTGNAVDFIDPPAGLCVSDAVRVYPHEGRSGAERRWVDYYWCLYDGLEGPVDINGLR